MASVLLEKMRRFAGIGTDGATHLDKWLSMVGGFTGIAAIALISQSHLGLTASASIVASMGSSAVLLFAVPHGPLSQPWPVLGGHLVSAGVGVACANLIAEPMLAAAVAVGLSISVMHYLRCIHPQGGATALGAVIGGEGIHELGFQFVITPVLLNATVILTVALLFNAPFTWRRYPAVLARTTNAGTKSRESVEDTDE